ncbi:hypothetical protein [Campylobacter sp.]|uniref:hypothetical protein n=1 Tax=Campylobacter sp. TaxID=205 RepID=UPI002A6910F3|nr:hypothetical protein [Campylobacter sp.]MDD7703193.1 hypothetical protein [Campylobacteraceae bacterium]MDY2634914.1 hypothetical protein [Campylobacter sp.]
MTNTRAILKFKSEFKISSCHFLIVIAPVRLCEDLGILEFPKQKSPTLACLL